MLQFTLDVWGRRLSAACASSGQVARELWREAATTNIDAGSMSAPGGGSSPRLRPRRLAQPHRWWRPDDVRAHGTTRPLPDVHERRGRRGETDDSRRRHYQQRCRSMPLTRYASDDRTLCTHGDRTCGPSHAWSYPHRLTQHLSAQLPEDWTDTPLALPQAVLRRSGEPISVVCNSCMPPELLSR